MAIVPWRNNNAWSVGFRDLEQLRREMNQLFNNSLTRWTDEEGAGLAGTIWSPAVDVRESKDSYIVKADVPGLSKEDIDVSIEGDTLTITGEKKKEEEKKEEGVLRTERMYGKFVRSFSLPSSIDAGAIKASYKDGVLELVVPKKEEAKPKQIKVDVK